MARAVRICPVCKRRYPAHKNRKTCSDECRDAQLVQNQAVRAQIAAETKAEKARKKSEKATRKSNIPWDPSPAYIREQCSLIRSGLLVINGDRTTHIPPAS